MTNEIIKKSENKISELIKGLITKNNQENFKKILDIVWFLENQYPDEFKSSILKSKNTIDKLRKKFNQIFENLKSYEIKEDSTIELTLKNESVIKIKMKEYAQIIPSNFSILDQAFLLKPENMILLNIESAYKDIEQ